MTDYINRGHQYHLDMQSSGIKAPTPKIYANREAAVKADESAERMFAKQQNALNKRLK